MLPSALMVFDRRNDPVVAGEAGAFSFPAHTVSAGAEIHGEEQRDEDRRLENGHGEEDLLRTGHLQWRQWILRHPQLRNHSGNGTSRASFYVARSYMTVTESGILRPHQQQA
jgi:hypothetical protein